MDHLERVLDEKAGDLADALTTVGFSDDEARRFLVQAAAELKQSYAWHAAACDGPPPITPDAAGELLAGIRGRALALRVGLTTEKTWAGLREFVPAVLEATTGTHGGSSPAGGSGAGSAGVAGFTTFDVGFGLTLDRGENGSNGSSRYAKRVGVSHPVFGRFLSLGEEGA